MEAVNLRQNLIDSISTLPNDMLEEMYKFLNFLEYKNRGLNPPSKKLLANLKYAIFITNIPNPSSTSTTKKSSINPKYTKVNPTI